MNIKITMCLLIIVSRLSFAQTLINLARQGRDVDFSAAPSTKPAQTGTTLPTTCSAGAVFILLSNPAGQNVYVCTGPNNWSLQVGGGGGTPNIMVVSASANSLSVGANCTSAFPCNVRVGSLIFAFTNGMTASLLSGTGTAYV